MVSQGEVGAELLVEIPEAIGVLYMHGLNIDAYKSRIVRQIEIFFMRKAFDVSFVCISLAILTPAHGGNPPILELGEMVPNFPVQITADGQRVSASVGAENYSVPKDSGQEHRKYDLRPYSAYLQNVDRPHRAVVDWVLRETGTDMWFTEPFGFFNATRDSLSVYHTSEVQKVVASVVERFVAGDKDPQLLRVELLSVGNPNWRLRASTLLQNVTVQCPGLQAWLLNKEASALMHSLLKQRLDVREVQTDELVVYNGQTGCISKSRVRNFVQSVDMSPIGWPPYTPRSSSVAEGYKVTLSPLLSVDQNSLDCVVELAIQQVEKLFPVDLEFPLASGQYHRTRVEVPQVFSWQFKERFRWPSDKVLLLSSGFVANPYPSDPSSVALALNSFSGASGTKVEVLMFLEFRGKASENLSTTTRTDQAFQGASSRSRY